MTKIKGDNQARRGRQEDKIREINGTFMREPYHLEHAKKEKREIYCLLSCRTRLGTVYTPYQWRGNSYSLIIIIINILIHYCRFIVRTNTIIYNNQQQKKMEKERGEEVVVVIPLAWFPSDNVLFIVPVIHIIIGHYTNLLLTFRCTY